MDQVSGARPPVADNCCEYADPTDPPGREPVEIVNPDTPTSIVIEKLRVVVFDKLSVTVAVKLKLPDAEGTPLITPAGESVNPAGADPDQR